MTTIIEANQEITGNEICPQCGQRVMSGPAVQIANPNNHLTIHDQCLLKVSVSILDSVRAIRKLR